MVRARPWLWFVLTAVTSLALHAQGGPPRAMPVRYTPAREHNLRQMLALPGTVEAQTASVVASPVEGLVEQFPGKEGTRVAKGHVLAKLRTTPLQLRLSAQKAALQEAEARFKQAESNLTRSKELFAAGVVSRQQLDENQSEFNAWQGRTESLRAEIARIEDDLERSTIRAPFAGVVARERTEVGQWIEAGGPVVELLAMGAVEIRVEVPERNFAQVRNGSPAKVMLDALPGLKLSGRVISRIPQADPEARTFPIKVRVSNPRGQIAAGMLAQVSFPAGESYRATVVPKDAIVTRGPASFLFRVNGENKVDQVAVETGSSSGSWIEVRSGEIRAGDKVVTRGNERIMPGMAVEATLLEYQTP
jgi:RND family efflux transporter MFP subunit